MVLLLKQLHQPEGLRLRKMTIPEHARQTAQNLVQKSLSRDIHYLITKDHQIFHKIQQQKIVKYWDIKPVSKEIKLQLHRFSFLLKATL